MMKREGLWPLRKCSSISTQDSRLNYPAPGHYPLKGTIAPKKPYKKGALEQREVVLFGVLSGKSRAYRLRRIFIHFASFNSHIVCALVHALFRPQTKTHFEDTFLSGRVRERRREDTFRRHIKRRRISPRRRITPRRHISKTH